MVSLTFQPVDPLGNVLGVRLREIRIENMSEVLEPRAAVWYVAVSTKPAMRLSLRITSPNGLMSSGNVTELKIEVLLAWTALLPARREESGQNVLSCNVDGIVQGESEAWSEDHFCTQKGQSEFVMEQRIWVPTAGVASRWVKNQLSGNISCVQVCDAFQQSSFACFSQMFETTWARPVTEAMTLQIEVPGVSKFRVVWNVASIWILFVPRFLSETHL